MKWTEIPAKNLLDRSFLLGLAGILLALIPLVFPVAGIPLPVRTGWMNGIGIGLQLLAMSLAVLVIRKRNLPAQLGDKAKLMTLVLAVALLFFILV